MVRGYGGIGSWESSTTLAYWPILLRLDFNNGHVVDDAHGRYVTSSCRKINSALHLKKDKFVKIILTLRSKRLP
jgi:hypothetical protein